MATSESDDFESADEEMNARKTMKYQQQPRAKKYTSIGSDSDDDVEFIPVQNHAPVKKYSKQKSPPQRKPSSSSSQEKIKSERKKAMDKSEINKEELSKTTVDSNKEDNVDLVYTKTALNKKERPPRQRKSREAQSTKKLGATKIEKLPNVEESATKSIVEKKEEQSFLIQESSGKDDEKKNLQDEMKNAEKQSKLKNEATVQEKNLEEDVPEELKSNLKFKDIFKPDGWEGLSENVVLPDDLSDDKYQPVLDKLSKLSENSQENTNDVWGGWGSWGVSSLLNTASVGVSTLTSHVSQGLSYLEESLGVPDPEILAVEENREEKNLKEPEVEILDANEKIEEGEKKPEEQQESQSQYLSSFGFGNLISSMSSITKLVETTSTKVISGGLDTLETLGKKTMEVLQEGDPGLKKKRAFFLNDSDKPILSHVLREAKDKADLEEKSIEEKELTRKVHFESLFDDYQGLVHLEALEMLSKQCNIKIQEQLVNLDGSELTSIQETLDEVKELCDLGDEDEDEDDELKDKSFKSELEEARKDLGISITYDKLVDIWDAVNLEITTDLKQESVSQREILQKAICALAQFTAYSVERFHKTAELILIKEHRSTVNEADSLVQLTKMLSYRIGCIANLYCNRLHEFKEETIKSEINSSITTISLEATNASSYIQESFRLLVPILQVGTI